MDKLSSSTREHLAKSRSKEMFNNSASSFNDLYPDLIEMINKDDISERELLHIIQVLQNTECLEISTPILAQFLEDKQHPFAIRIERIKKFLNGWPKYYANIKKQNGD